MSGFSLRSRLVKGDQIFAAWVTAAIPRMTETILATGFDAAMFDLQHGEASFEEARQSIAAARRLGRPAGVRVCLEGYAEAARFLDLGAEVAIMPMINSVADAEKLVATLKYPPVGGRSWGPTRAAGVLGLSMEEYRAGANDSTIALAMIETRPAVDALDDILDVPGLDGVFVGPSDLSISLTNGAKLDHRLPEALTIMERLIKSAKAKGKVTAIFCAGGEAAARNAAMGFDIMAVGSDWGFLTDGAKAALKVARGDAAEGAPRY